MVFSPWGCVLSSSARQTFFSSASAGGNFITTTESEVRSRQCPITDTIVIRPFDNSFVQQVRISVLLSRTIEPWRSSVVSQASNPRVTTSEQIVSKDSNGKEPAKSRGEVQVKRQNQKQAKFNNTPASSSEASSGATRERKVVKDGFAGLSTLKAQLEQERPRTSRVTINDTGGGVLLRQKQAEQQKRQKVVHSKQSPSFVSETSPMQLTSEGQIHRGGPTLIQVRNLAKQVTEEEYRWVMQSIPEIRSWKYLSDQQGLCLGYGFCEVHADADAAAIMQILSAQVFHGKKMEASLSESSREYTQSVEKQVRETVAHKVIGKKVPSNTSSSSSIKGRAEKGNPNIRNQAQLRVVSKALPTSKRWDATEMLRTGVDASSQGYERTDGTLKNELEDWNQSVEPEQSNASPPLLMGADATEMGSSTSGDSSPGYESVHNGEKLTGRSVLEALQRAAALRESSPKPRRRKGRSGGRSSSDSDSEGEERSSQQDPLPPFVFKSEWATRIEELENDMKNMRELL